MKKFLLLVALVLFAVPVAVSAHEHRMVEAGGKAYSFTVGSLNEPLVVGDKSGVDLRVMTEGATPKPVEGLQDSLKVEVTAGSEKRVFDIDPVYDTPGSYKAIFYPTTTAPLIYRFFGKIGNDPVDVSFMCKESGGFGCPLAREDYEFPKQSQTNTVATVALVLSILGCIIGVGAWLKK